MMNNLKYICKVLPVMMLWLAAVVSCGVRELDSGGGGSSSPDSDKVILLKDLYHLDVSGGLLEVDFSTNVPDDRLSIFTTAPDWIGQPGRSKAASVDYYLSLLVKSNDSDEARIGYIMFYTSDDPYEPLATVTVVQDGRATGHSEDFSADGEYEVLQTSSAGTGIPVVIMGDGFIDKEIADGTYGKVMKRAMENLFSEEPLASLREYFDVYAVTAVSSSNLFMTGYDTALDCELEGGSSTGISGNEKAVMNYVNKVDGIDMGEVLAVVVLNTPVHAGTTYFGYGYDDGSGGVDFVEFAIAYCPVITDLGSEEFRQVLVHEAVGHGFAKLEDEYSYEENGMMPSDEIASVKMLQEQGWALNVDFTADRSSVLWKDFLADSRYDASGLGIYRGACTYMSGVYRPSYDSMMNSNTVGFNAPSRKAIYDLVMRRSGAGVVSYEDFVAFDIKTGAIESVWPDVYGGSRASGGPEVSVPFARPRFTGKILDR